MVIGLGPIKKTNLPGNPSSINDFLCPYQNLLLIVRGKSRLFGQMINTENGAHMGFLIVLNANIPNTGTQSKTVKFTSKFSLNS
jgi:hypothetical protein